MCTWKNIYRSAFPEETIPFEHDADDGGALSGLVSLQDLLPRVNISRDEPSYISKCSRSVSPNVHFT